MALIWEDVVKLLLAVVVGGLIGAEREYRDKAAGFRTIIFICLGATLFTLFSLKLGGDDDPVRIAANVVSGVGFLGAGAILRQGERVTGLTTAATIWLAAAMGMGIGGGSYPLVGAGVLMVLLVLVVFPRIEWWIDNVNETRTYEIVGSLRSALYDELETAVEGCGLRIRACNRVKTGDDLVWTWSLIGPPKGHEEFTGKLLAHPDVKQFKV